MSDTTNTQPCPDCGQPNPHDAASCEHCNFPLRTETPEEPEAPQTEEVADEPAETDAEPEVEAPAPASPQASAPAAVPVPPRLARLRKKRQRTSNLSLSIWLFTGALAALSLILFAVRANVERLAPEVPGADPAQQERADALHAAVEDDSTNVDARVALADVLYDTGNWPEAIIHYRSAIRQDSSRHEAIVDLGVCYYNLGDSDEAERHFQLALSKVPNQTIALFNMGILNERREDNEAALQYYHRALQTEPREEIRATIIEAIGRAQEKTGKLAPPLPDGQ